MWIMLLKFMCIELNLPSNIACKKYSYNLTLTTVNLLVFAYENFLHGLETLNVAKNCKISHYVI